MSDDWQATANDLLGTMRVIHAETSDPVIFGYAKDALDAAGSKYLERAVPTDTSDEATSRRERTLASLYETTKRRAEAAAAELARMQLRTAADQERG